MNKIVEVFIYHTKESELLIVNHETKSFEVFIEPHLIDMFRTSEYVNYISYVTSLDVAYYIDKLLNKGYKDRSLLYKCQ